jgi:hypothetical protein
MNDIKPIPRGPVHSAVFVLERTVKGMLFHCQMCGQCILHNCGYVCPMRCPKRLRNGPCGGYSEEGKCEVYPERDCTWLRIYRRSGFLHLMHDYTRMRTPIDYGLWRTASWHNLLRHYIDLQGRQYRRLEKYEEDEVPQESGAGPAP